MIQVSRLKELFELDEEMGVLRWRVNRRGFTRAGDIAGCKNRNGYVEVTVDLRKMAAHRIVFAIANGYFPHQVDHINGVKDDNRPANLRAATNVQNSLNRRLGSNNKSGVKGVFWSKRFGKWIAGCKADGRRHHIGYFCDIESAANAVKMFRETRHGEFARHE